MPELPEVETIARYIRPALVGRRVVNVRLLWSRTLETPSPDRFQELLLGQIIQEVRRRGKFIILTLTSYELLIHLRMSGDLRIVSTESEIAAHDRLILSFDDNNQLVFNDPRKFGRAWLVDDPACVIGDLGPEPLDDTFAPADLYQALQTRHRQLKPLLLDQSFLAGMGNIYVDESLHRARLHPLTTSQAISHEQAEALWLGIRESLQEGILRNGASIDWVYRGGDFQNYFQVYQRTGEPCLHCGTPIERIIVGQRGTHYCPTCQPLSNR